MPPPFKHNRHNEYEYQKSIIPRMSLNNQNMYWNNKEVLYLPQGLKYTRGKSEIIPNIYHKILFKQPLNILS